jgi:hypothetical protein
LLTSGVYYKVGPPTRLISRTVAQLFVNPDLDAGIQARQSWSYGNELYLEKKTGKTTGWMLHLGLGWLSFQPPARLPVG